MSLIPSLDSWISVKLLFVVLCVICYFGFKSLVLAVGELQASLAEQIHELSSSLADRVSEGIRQADEERANDLELEMENQMLDKLAVKSDAKEAQKPWQLGDPCRKCGAPVTQSELCDTCLEVLFPTQHPK